MILRKKVVSLLLIIILCLGMASGAEASEISETEKKAKELENQKKEAEGEKGSWGASEEWEGKWSWGIHHQDALFLSMQLSKSKRCFV